jgi:hypothetical protein
MAASLRQISLRPTRGASIKNMGWEKKRNTSQTVDIAGVPDLVIFRYCALVLFEMNGIWNNISAINLDLRSRSQPFAWLARLHVLTYAR